MSADHTQSPEPESSGLTEYAATKNTRPSSSSLRSLPSLPGTSSRSSTEQHLGRQRGRTFERASNPDDRDQTLREELAWSIALIGGVVAYLVLVSQFAS
jgi:hypothetical protein